ncbi:MAG: RdgB/HAM1 family non-canonical purine NTP pyrophosphatase [Coriobacteriales bacterium]
MTEALKDEQDGGASKPVKRVVVATSNPHKVTEIMSIIDIDGYEFVPLSQLGDFPSPVEDGTTFLENAEIKAVAAHEETGLASMADDSGIVVDALGGAPGIYSSRYSGEHGNDAANNAKLLLELDGVEDRTARFTCAIVFIDEDGTKLTSEASVEGKIDDHEHGDGGFGYDPLFLPDEYGGELSMAELTMDQKNAISHRGKALRNLRSKLLGL